VKKSETNFYIYKEHTASSFNITSVTAGDTWGQSEKV